MQANEYKINKNFLLALDLNYQSEFIRALEIRSKISENPKAIFDFSEENAKPTVALDSNIAVINISGPIMYADEWWHQWYGYTSVERIKKDLSIALADGNINTIILNISSPGGEVTGVSELANFIYEARVQKRIVSFANGHAHSAAFWLACAAGEFYCLGSGMVGSVGVYSMHLDYSAYMEKAGIKATFVQAGEKKTDGNAYEPLSESAKQEMQTIVDSFYKLFIDDLAKFRGVSSNFVEENFGQGGVFLAEEAQKRNMIDGVRLPENLLYSQKGARQNIESNVNDFYIQNNQELLDLDLF